MPYSYHESTRLSTANANALKSLAATGELPKGHYWNSLRTQYDANPGRFDRTHNVVVSALMNRDAAQRAGTLGASAPLFPTSKFFAYAGGKHALNMTRFDYWHPFLGRLFEIVLPTPPPAAQQLIPPPIGTPGNLNPPPAGGSNTGTGTGTGGGGGDNNPSVTVPEPASAVLTGLALVAVLIVATLRRRKAAAPPIPAIVA